MSEPGAQDVSGGDGVAIIGMACRFPGASSFQEYWQRLRAGENCTTTLTEEELKASGVSALEYNDPNYVRVAGIIDGEDLFDANFFNISPREAKAMDPQHRIFLEMAWEALEHAGYAGGNGAGLVGVYAGTSFNSYLLSHVLRQTSARMVGDDFQTLMGNEQDYLTTRASYKLNLRGPSVTVQTACSTSLVAVHMACESLLGGECDLALAGGVAINIPQRVGYRYGPEAIFSADGLCRAFDAEAAGTVPGSGAGIVVLRRLDEALARRDPIHAIIRGSAVNNDGSSKVGYTTPSVEGQRDVVLEALASAEIDPASIAYVEAHGTATPLGDPIEVQALTEAFRRHTQATGFCGIGSVKTNIGHLNTASGIAGLLKVVAALKHRELPPSLHYRTPSTKIDFGQTPFRVVSQLQAWPATSLPRRAGVSSFGIGGTNAHVVVEEAPAVAPEPTSLRHHAIVLSAKSPTALDHATRRLAQFCADSPALSVADVAYTLQRGRVPMRFRRAFLADNTQDIACLLSDGSAKVVSGEAVDEAASVRLFFPGEAALSGKTIRELMDDEPLFADALGRCVEWATRSGADARLPAENEICGSPWLVVAIQYSLAHLLAGWGVRPRALSGIGNGLLAAAIVAEVMPLESGLSMAASGSDLAQPALADPAVPIYDACAERWLSKKELLDAVAGPFARISAGNVFPAERGTDLVIEVGPQGGTAGDRHPILPPTDMPVRAGKFILDALLRLWVRGASIELSNAYAMEPRRRIPLPVYPFERVSYWWEAPDPRREIGARAADDMFWIPSWKQEAAPAAASAQNLPATWLVVTDDPGIVARIEQELGESGSTVVRLGTGQKFDQQDALRYAVRPGSAEDYRRLWDSLAQQSRLPDYVVHLTNWGDHAIPLEDLGAAMDRTFHGLRAMAKSLDGRVQRPKRIAVISSAAVQIAGEGTADPTKALLRGACCALRDDLGLDCIQLDVPKPVPASLQEKWIIRQILLEIRSKQPAPLVAWRGATRWVQTVEPLHLARPSGVPSKLRPDGTYIVTGGLGGIGLAVARYLVTSVAARVVLVGRHGIERLGSGTTALDEITSFGDRIEVVRADVSDPDELRVAFETARRRFGAVHGAFHAAGLPGSGHVRESTEADARGVLAAKVSGTLALARLAEEYGLDFLLLFSSTVSLTGAPHQSDYCAANAFLDAYAQSQAFIAPGRVISVNWDRWRNVGMSDPAGNTQVITIGPEDWRLNEHRVAGARVFPGAGHLDVVSRRFRQQHPDLALAMRQVSFTQLLKVDEGMGAELRTTIRDAAAGEHHFRLTSAAGTRTHIAGMIRALDVTPQTVSIDLIRNRCTVRTLDPGQATAPTDENYRIGPRWRSLRSVWVGEDEALAELHLPDRFHDDLPAHLLHPALLDVATSFYTYDQGGHYYVPTSFREMIVHDRLPSQIYVHATRQPATSISGGLSLDIRIMDRDGKVLVEFDGFSFSGVSLADGSASGPEISDAEGSRGISREEGIECLARLLHHGTPPQVIVTPADLTRVVAPEDRSIEPASSTLHPRPDLHVAYLAPRNDAERSIAQVFMTLLGLQRIGVNDDFLELGADSTIFMEAVLGLYEAAAIVVTPEQFYEYSTIAKLAQSPMVQKRPVNTAATDAAADGDRNSLPSQMRIDLEPHPEELAHLRKLFGH